MRLPITYVAPLAVCAALAVIWSVAPRLVGSPPPATAETAQPARFGTAGRGQRWGRDYLPNLHVVDQDGKAYRFYDDLIKDKRVVINFIFTTCTDICPLTTARMSSLAERLGDAVGRDVHFYSITVDPEHDGPKELKQYADAFRAPPGWKFLTGRPEDVRAVRDKLGERSRVLNEHKHEILLGDSRNGTWSKDSVFGDIERVAINIKSMDPDFRLPKPAAGIESGNRLVVEDAPGQALFTKACASCHTIGRGDRVGPDLAQVSTRRDLAWLTEFITRPDRVFARGDATAVALAAAYKGLKMPNLGLSETDAADVLAYIDAQSYVVVAADANDKRKAGARAAAPGGHDPLHQH